MKKRFKGNLQEIYDENAAVKAENITESSSENDVSGTSENSERKSKPIGDEEISNAKHTLRKYMTSKQVYDVKYKNNFDTYNLLYTENGGQQYVKGDDGKLRPVLIPKKAGAQCLNVIMNKHADEMDNMPEAICLPRAKDDIETARMLNSVLPCTLERNGFRKIYSREKIDKLVGGCGGYSVTWNAEKENGLGDIEINRLDLLTVFWEPHIENIQDSKNLFILKAYDLDTAKEIWPQLSDISSEALTLQEYRTFDNNSKYTDKAIVVDWYYKKRGVLHFAKFCCDTLIFASENEGAEYKTGWYNHGLYPVVLEPCFILADTPAGFGYVDICRAPQAQLDEIKNDLLKNIKVNSQPRSLINRSAGVNIDDFTDLSKSVVETNADPNNAIRHIETKDIASGSLNMYNAIINEIKETTGCNDASNGAGAAGVTSGAAIYALQEAGGKISRDGTQSSYFVFVELCNMIIELYRQFYTLPRIFTITGENNQDEFVEFDNSDLQDKPITSIDENGEVIGPFTGVDGDILKRRPIFDIKVKAQKASPFATAAQNEIMMNLFKMGAFNPEAADAALIMLDGMTFEGKDEIMEKIRKNAQLISSMQQLQQQNQMMSAMLASQNAQSAAAEQGIPTAAANQDSSPEGV